MGVLPLGLAGATPAHQRNAADAGVLPTEPWIARIASEMRRQAAAESR
jgi:hypothetical protein